MIKKKWENERGKSGEETEGERKKQGKKKRE